MQLMDQKTKNKKIKKQMLRWGRIGVQIIFFLLLPALFSQAFGGLKEIFSAMGKGGILSWSAFVKTLVLLCIITIIVGRFFCGWLCAFGALGDWIYQISVFVQKKTGKKLPKISEQNLHRFQKLKYVILFLVLLLCFLQKGSLITENSPWTVFSLLTARNFSISAYPVAVILLLFIIIGMAIQERFFCQFLCPMGAVFSLLPELPVFRLKRKGENCISKCQACKDNCPVHIKIDEIPAREGECIRCGRCTQICPKENIYVLKKKEK